jgi:hypothetical protein
MGKPMSESIEPMTEDRFWALVEESGGDAGKMTKILTWLPKEEIIAFELRFGILLYLLDREDIHDVTDGSDDGFLYARCWIISQGRAYCESVLADPSNAIEDEEDNDWLYPAMDAYEALAGEGAWPEAIERHWQALGFPDTNEAAWPSRYGNR